MPPTAALPSDCRRASVVSMKSSSVLSLFLAMAVSATGPTAASELRSLCPDRPGKATPACIVDKGHLQIETGIIDWSRDHHAGIDINTIAYTGSEMRYGLTSTTEIGVTWSPFNTVTLHDRKAGTRNHASGIGDVKLALRQSLANPDGSGIALAIEPFITAPTGGNGITAGDWAGGVLLPFAAALGGGFGLATTAEVDWNPNASGSGHHASYLGVIGVSHPVGPIQAGMEFAASRDDDPTGATTQATADLTLAWVPASRPDMQFDAGLNAGLNSNTPGLEIYLGVSRRF
jgi:hypothetical protein